MKEETHHPFKRKKHDWEGFNEARHHLSIWVRYKEYLNDPRLMN